MHHPTDRTCNSVKYSGPSGLGSATGCVRTEGNVLFNDNSNQFIYGYMVKDQSDGVKGSQLPPPHGLLNLISSKEYFICTIQQTAHTTTFVIPVMEY